MYSFDTHSPRLSSSARRAIARIEGAGQVIGNGFAIARDLVLTCAGVAERLGSVPLEAIFVARRQGEVLSIPVVEVVWRGGADDRVCMVRLQRPLPDIQSVLSVGRVRRIFVAGQPDPLAVRDDGGSLTELQSHVIMVRPSLVRACSGAPVIDEDERAVGIYLVHGEEPELHCESMPLGAIWSEVEAQVRRSWELLGGPLSASWALRGRPPGQEDEQEEDDDEAPKKALFVSFDPREQGVDDALADWLSSDEARAPAVAAPEARLVVTFDLASSEPIVHGREGSRPVQVHGGVVVHRYDPHQEGGCVLLYLLGTAADGRLLELEGEYIQQGQRFMFASRIPGEDLLIALPREASEDGSLGVSALTLHAQVPDGERKSYELVVLGVPVPGTLGGPGSGPPWRS